MKHSSRQTLNRLLGNPPPFLIQAGFIRYCFNIPSLLRRNTDEDTTENTHRQFCQTPLGSYKQRHQPIRGGKKRSFLYQLLTEIGPFTPTGLQPGSQGSAWPDTQGRLSPCKSENRIRPVAFSIDKRV